MHLYREQMPPCYLAGRVISWRPKVNCTIEDLYKSFRGSLRNFIASKTRDVDLAEDLVQETFVKIARYCHCGEGCTHPKSFLYKVATNVLADHFQATRRRTFEQTARTADEDNMNAEVIACLVPLIDSLPSLYKEAVKLADVEQVSQQEIAERMGISLSGAKSRIQRGRAKLKDMLLAMCDMECDSHGNILHCKPRR